MLKEKLEKLMLPMLSERREMLEMLSHQLFGMSPEAPASLQAKILEEKREFGGKALRREIRLTFNTPSGPFSFPYALLTPAKQEKSPAFVSVNFRKEIPHHYLPAEEMIDRGFALAALYYQDVTSDSGEWDGIAPFYPRDEKIGWGKIGMWAFAMSRVMDDLLTRPEIDEKRIAAVGHSRLGKTALWCGAQDERFSLVVSNASGCAGAALARGNTGEKVKDITANFPYWFCGHYSNWAEKENEMPFDQHMLLALIATRNLYVSSADEDAWACPENEFLSCAAASSAWQKGGKGGLVTPDCLPQLHQPLHAGEIGYHIRKGTHYFSRTDWGYLMDYRDTHKI